MEGQVPILIVSCRLENKKLLARIFAGLPLDIYTVSSIKQAKETISMRPFSVVFCEERLPDGSYGELLKETHLIPGRARFVVMLCTGEWNEYLEALRLGAEEVLRCPLQPTDVDLALIHATRNDNRKNDANLQQPETRAMGAVA